MKIPAFSQKRKTRDVFCRGHLLGDPSGAAAQKLMEVSRSLNGTSFRNLPLGFPRSLVRSTLGFPRGEAAERSEADEGRRQVGFGMQLDEWRLFRFSPFNVLMWRF